MTDQIQLTVNGETRSFDAGISVDGLLSVLGLPGERIAVELNRRVVQRKDWPERILQDADRVEIVHFVGGG
ncbi:MAG: sulfur carrier protein ThiS [Blastocatellia bacterium]|mgnify:CR=1 FL=1|nr:sulfur carrier protein ThiS [Blastocatellia bacterium]MBK6428591.1 sulfur carrier protein ThiS [Blastocatellia bacterium]